MTSGTFALRRAAVVYVALLCAIKVFAVETQPPTQSPQKYPRCFPATKKSSNERSQSIQAAGGTLYEMQLISPSLLEYLQGLAVQNVTVDVITACASAAEQKKMNSFQYEGTVCTLYTALPDAAVLPSCANVLTAVVYKVKTSLNSATVPLPQVVNVTLDTTNNTLTATWTTKYFSNCIQGFKVTLNNVILTINLNDLVTYGSVKVSGGTFKSVPVGGTVSGVIVSKTTYQLVVVSPAPCVEYTVSITALGADGRAIGAAGTGKVTTLSQSNSTATVRYDSLTLDNLTVSWHFDDCGLSAYQLRRIFRDGMQINSTLDKFTTSLTFLGYDVCSSNLYGISVSALDVNGNILGSPMYIGINFMPIQNGILILPFANMNACMMGNASETGNFSTGLKECKDIFKGEPFKYGRAAYGNLTSTHGIFGFIDLRYSATSGTWIWGNGEVEPKNSTIWNVAPPDPTKGTCTYYSGGTKVWTINCSKQGSTPCYKIY